MRPAKRNCAGRYAEAPGCWAGEGRLRAATAAALLRLCSVCCWCRAAWAVGVVSGHGAGFQTRARHALAGRPRPQQTPAVCPSHEVPCVALRSRTHRSFCGHAVCCGLVSLLCLCVTAQHSLMELGWTQALRRASRAQHGPSSYCPHRQPRETACMPRRCTGADASSGRRRLSSACGAHNRW
jgi:hypothetical protein